MKTRIIVALALAVTVAAVPLLAHHTAAYLYDVMKPVSMQGVVTEVASAPGFSKRVRFPS